MRMCWQEYIYMFLFLFFWQSTTISERWWKKVSRKYKKLFYHLNVYRGLEQWTLSTNKWAPWDWKFTDNSGILIFSNFAQFCISLNASIKIVFNQCWLKGWGVKIFSHLKKFPQHQIKGKMEHGQCSHTFSEIFAIITLNN